MNIDQINIYQLIFVHQEDLVVSLRTCPVFEFFNYSDDIFYSALKFSYN